jgi:Ca-activated chloride channel family protein
MTEKKALKLKTRWEHDEIPAGKATQRGLLLEVTGREMEKEIREERPPLNLALVIDRSGSMSGGRLAAARKAAIGISQKLCKRDRLSIVAYDTEILVLLDGVKQNKAGREAAKAAISALQTGGRTDLGGGWMMGAKCVAEVMERKGLQAGQVLLLSDGRANHGITDPAELARHAGEMAARGVTSSCVGIGHGYSPLQLDAIAEAGRGQLHHSDNPDEIVDVVMGELGEMMTVAAHSARLLLHFPENTGLQQLTRFRSHDGGHYLELDLGDIPSGRTRKVAFMADIGERVEAREHLSFKAKLVWKNEEQKQVGFGSDFQLSAVDPAAFDPKGKNRRVARTIAELWLARMGYEAMIFNERHQYREAVDTFTRNDIALESLIAELEEKERQALLDQKQRVKDAVADEWSGSGKLLLLSLSKKFMRSEADHTGRKPEDWSDNARD